MGSSFFSLDIFFDIFALNGSMGKTFFCLSLVACWLLASGSWRLAKPIHATFRKSH